jgi:multiple sugar transport system substrate-binding protein
MKRRLQIAAAACVLLAAALPDTGFAQRLGAKGSDTQVVHRGEGAPPRVVKPCAPGKCLFAGQTVTIVAAAGNAIAGPIHELKQEYEEATGAHLNIVELPIDEHFASFISDATNRGGKYDISVAGAWWLGEFVEAGFIIPLDKYYNDPRFPKWDIEDVLPGPRSLLSYGNKLYMVANDHDGQVMYYRRDLIEDPKHKAAFQRRFGYPLGVPQTWDQFRAVAEYFNGQDLNGDAVPDHGLTLALAVGSQGMFHFLSMSAPFVIGPTNPKLYWFDPNTMAPLVESPGHVRALETLAGLVQFGPREMLNWDLGKSWDYFLAGRAALTFTWADLGALAQQPGSRVKGKVGVAPMPGTTEYYSIARRQWVKSPGVNKVGNTIGGSWSGVISRSSKSPEAAYYLLALMATKEKSLVYAARGWDGIDPGRRSHFLPPFGTGSLDQYLDMGWDPSDVRTFLNAYAESFANPLQFPYLRVPGAFSYSQSIDVHLQEAVSGQLPAAAALKAIAIDFDEITLRMGREKQKRSYRASLF